VLHPARKISFDELYAGLQAACDAGMAKRVDCHATGRALYIYSNSCVYDDGWNDFTLLARGLILHPSSKQVIATPFPKFFNAGERNGVIPELPFEVFEKIDGSLAIIHNFNGTWSTATKGSFDSPQARWAQDYVLSSDADELDPSVTYLAEAIYPQNRIVVPYETSELVLLAAYRKDGSELTYDELQEVGSRIGWRVAKRYEFASFAELVERSRLLPKTEEGFVIRFSDGLRLKLKGDEYRRIHALISRCTPLAMWEAMQAGDDLAAIRRDLPEEFWVDFDSIVANLSRRIQEVTDKVARAAAECANLSDKDVGLRLRSLDRDVQPFIFHWRKQGGKLEGRPREALFRFVRPTGNLLPGYTPSYAMKRVTEEAV
jgi:RNA ligase